MKKLVVLVMVFSLSFSFAGDFGLFKVGPTVGLIMPEDPYNVGFQIGAKAYAGSLMDGKIGLYPVLSYWRSSADQFEDFTLSNIKFGVDGHYDLSEYVDGLYAGAGLALNIVKTKWEIDLGALGGKHSDDNSETKFGISLLAGYDLELSGKPIFVEGNYDIINNLSTIGLKAGMYFDLKN
jgi:hypothetical protein